MTWLAYAFIGLTIWSATAIADRYFLLKHVKSTRFYLVVPALLQFAVTLPFVIPFSIPHASVLAVAAALANGAFEVIFLYYLFVAVKSEEVSRVFPLTAAGPILTLVLGWIFLHEALTQSELVAFGLFLMGGFLLAARFGGGTNISASKAIKPLIIGSFLASVFTLLLRYAFVESNFWAGFFYSRLGFFIAGLVLWAIYRKEISSEWHRLQTSVRVAVIGNQVVAVSGHAFYFLAISLASAALVQSVSASQSAIVLLFAVLASLWKPDLLDESIEYRDLFQKVIGVALIVSASYLLVS